MNDLYHVTWRPQSTTQHPLENPLHPAPTPHVSALEYLGKVKTPSKPAGAYRPPGARGAATPLAFKREDEGGAAFVRDFMAGGQDHAVNGFGKPRRREVPGAELVEGTTPPVAAAGPAQDGDDNLSKAALKNKKKREAKKAKEAEAKASGLTAPATNGDGSARSPERKDRTRSRSQSNYKDSPRTQSRRREGSRQRAGHGPPHATMAQAVPKLAPVSNGTPAPAPAAPELTVTSPGAGSAEEKKIRSLLKKLRAIDDLKMRQAGGEKLEGTQVLKIGTEEQVRKELGALGFSE